MTETSSPFIHPVSRLRDYLHALRLVLDQTRDHVWGTRVELGAHLTQLQTLAASQLAELEKLAAGVEALSSSREAQHAQLVEILRFVHDGGRWSRAGLRELRASDAYGRAFSDPDPLVSVVIPTCGRELLRERAIPSVLAQTYQNFEIVVVGDAAPDEARVAVESFGDSRLSFFNLPYGGPYPEEPEVAWRVSWVPPCNEAVRRARGLWIARLDDDDAFRPHHLERLLECARRDRVELAYARLAERFPDGQQRTLGSFPPKFGQFGLQAAIYHAGLADIFEYELADAAFGMTADWGFCLRTMEAGVRIGMLDEVTVDYYPSRAWTQRWEGDSVGPPTEPESSDARGEPSRDEPQALDP